MWLLWEEEMDRLDHGGWYQARSTNYEFGMCNAKIGFSLNVISLLLH